MRDILFEASRLASRYVRREMRSASLEYLDNLKKANPRTVSYTTLFALEGFSLLTLGHSTATLQVPTMLLSLGVFGTSASAHVFLNRLLSPIRNNKNGEGPVIDASFTVVDTKINKQP